jgi:hypothetical protein
MLFRMVLSSLGQAIFFPQHFEDDAKNTYKNPYGTDCRPKILHGTALASLMGPFV